jgi:hypothetical protein
MLIVLNEIHSSSGKLKKVKQKLMDLSRQEVAEGRFFYYFSLN